MAVISRKRLPTAVYAIPVQFSETSLNCTNQSIRGEIAPPIRAYDKGGILTNNSTVDTKYTALKVGTGNK